MSDFKAKMHQIQFPLHSRRSPSSKGAYFYGKRGEKGGEGKGKGTVGTGREGRVAPQLGSQDPSVLAAAAAAAALQHRKTCHVVDGLVPSILQSFSHRQQ